MWLLAFAIFVACKWLTWMTSCRAAPLGRQVAYWLAWPGLDADAFLAPAQPGMPRPSFLEPAIACVKIVLGLVLIACTALLEASPHDLVRGWLGMIGIVLVLHFGVFELLSWGWRRLGVDAKPPMQRPLASVRLSEFWGRRWNTAFRDLTSRFLYRPLKARLGGTWALLLGFVWSGLVHDLVISIPAGGGYGWPTLYFLGQGSAILLERSETGKRLGLGSGVRGRCFTLLVVVVPAFGLFHPPFVRTIVLPMLELFTRGPHA